MILSRQNSTAEAMLGEQISHDLMSFKTRVNLCSLALLELSVYKMITGYYKNIVVFIFYDDRVSRIMQIIVLANHINSLQNVQNC